MLLWRLSTALLGVRLVGVVQAVVPLPALATNGSAMLQLSPAFAIRPSDASSQHPVLDAAASRIEAALFAHGGRSDAAESSGAKLHTLVVNVTHSFERPKLGGDESYSLRISADQPAATLTAGTINGALHGLQTFAQLCHFDFDNDAVAISRVPWSIDDKPRFAHRGLMLDTSRHFYPPAALIPLLDAMSAVKMNVFHWHLSDSTSFPLIVPNTNLSAGAYGRSQRYSRVDVETVVQAATERGIRVVPEFDLPAHTAPAWCVGEPGICTDSATTVNPASTRLYEVIEAVIAAVAGPDALFPDEWIHLGGDEVTLSDWTDDPTIAAYLKQQHPGMSMTKAAEAEAYGTFIAKLSEIAGKYGRHVVHWEDVFDWAGPIESCGGVTPRLSNETIVQVFRGGFGPGPKPCKDQIVGGCVCGSNGAATTRAVVQAGYRAIWDPPSAWCDLSSHHDLLKI
jgi:hexosaminidase